jgi:hypothetical protein
MKNRNCELVTPHPPTPAPERGRQLGSLRSIVIGLVVRTHSPQGIGA